MAGACADGPQGPTPARGDLRAKLRADVAGTNCGASATIVTNEQDSVALQYGMNARVDTVKLCETWIGSDYTTTAAVTASSDDPYVGDSTIRTTTYANGTASAYDRSGNVVVAPSAAGGSTLFDVVLASSSQRQASYDDPYYGLSSSNGGCVPTPPQIVCTTPGAVPAPGAAAAGSTSGVSAAEEQRFTKHGLHRRGVRALVDDGVEIAPSPEGYRRFRLTQTGPWAAGPDAPPAQQVVISVDPKTELIMAEEATSPDGSTKARHTWKQTSSGYVRDQTVLDGEDVFGGQTVRSHSVITYLDVRVAAAAGAPPAPGS